MNITNHYQVDRLINVLEHAIDICRHFSKSDLSVIKVNVRQLKKYRSFDVSIIAFAEGYFQAIHDISQNTSVLQHSITQIISFYELFPE